MTFFFRATMFLIFSVCCCSFITRKTLAEKYFTKKSRSFREKLNIVGADSRLLAQKLNEVDIIIKDEGRFIDVSGVPDDLRAQSNTLKYVYMRDCFDEIIDSIIPLPKTYYNRGFVIMGAEGSGSSTFFLVLLKVLLEDPSKLGLKTKSFYYQQDTHHVTLYRHIQENEFIRESVDTRLDDSIPLFVDLTDLTKPPFRHSSGVSFIFSSFRPAHFKNLAKRGASKWKIIIPTWSAEEQSDLFSSSQVLDKFFNSKMAQYAYDNIPFYGGSILNNMNKASEQFVRLENYPSSKYYLAANLEYAVRQKGEFVCDKFFTGYFDYPLNFGIWIIPNQIFDLHFGDCMDMLVHRNPRKINNKYDFSRYTYSFASPRALRLLLAINPDKLANEARDKYNNRIGIENYDGNEFGLLCLHGFKISDIDFTAKPLTENLPQVKVRFPPKQILPMNWKKKKNYLQNNILYMPHYGSLESGDAFCLMTIEEKWTLIILKCTIDEFHPVKQSGIKATQDCFIKNSKLQVDDTVVMFMVPENGIMSTEQEILEITEKKKDGVSGDDLPDTIKVKAQYIIENALEFVDI